MQKELQNFGPISTIGRPLARILLDIIIFNRELFRNQANIVKIIFALIIYVTVTHI